MRILDLYTFAEKRNIAVIDTSLPETGSLSLMTDDGTCYIGMDQSVMDGDAVELVHLSHEIGHCETGSFYSIHTAVDCRQRHEHKADKWAIKKLVPVDALDDAIADGCTEIWDLAERFGVTEQFIRKAVCYYVHGNLATELYF